MKTVSLLPRPEEPSFPTICVNLEDDTTAITFEREGKPPRRFEPHETQPRSIFKEVEPGTG